MLSLLLAAPKTEPQDELSKVTRYPRDPHPPHKSPPLPTRTPDASQPRRVRPQSLNQIDGRNEQKQPQQPGMEMGQSSWAQSGGKGDPGTEGPAEGQEMYPKSQFKGKFSFSSSEGAGAPQNSQGGEKCPQSAGQTRRSCPATPNLKTGRTTLPTGICGSRSCHYDPRDPVDHHSRSPRSSLQPLGHSCLPKASS